MIPNGTRFIVLDIKTGWKRWENGKVVEFVTEIDGHYPKRHELGYDDESAWECGPDDKPTDPWQNSREGVADRSAYLCGVHLLHGLGRRTQRGRRSQECCPQRSPSSPRRRAGGVARNGR